jgi:iron complex outermembrane receptor protein
MNSLAIFRGVFDGGAESPLGTSERWCRTPLARAALVTLATCSAAARADHGEDQAPIKSLGTITITSGRPTSLPAQIPTTIEGVTRAQIEQTINASDSEDALKYLPSLNVRKRYIGDYDHAVLASRASGTGNSARSLVYADGILLSNLLGNGASFTPRWGLVSPEEIERVDVLYGPFSAAYPGNSVGAVVDYVTRMPTRLEGHVKFSGFSQNFSQYGQSDTVNGHQGSASLGNKSGNWAWWFDVSRLDSHAQPITFANKLVSSGVVAANGVAVTGAVADKNPKNLDWWILGSTNATHTIQDHAKLKLAYDFSPQIRASYTLGWWKNQADRTSQSFLRDAAGNPFYGSSAQPDINIGGRRFRLTPADFAGSRTDLEHIIQGLTLKSHTRGVWDWEVALSNYDYQRDQVRSPTAFAPARNGSIADLGGTGWKTLALKGIWRPGAQNQHVLEFGYQCEHYQLRSAVYDTADWLFGAPAARSAAFAGDTQLQTLYGQDTWRISPDWKATLGGRWEQWRAYRGSLANASTSTDFAERRETTFSPKAALAYQLAENWQAKASLGRAVRNPTVSELYQGALSGGILINNDPNLRPEKSWTSEWTIERALDKGTLRGTLFHEATRDALYSQTNVSVTPNVTNIQNVGRIRTSGLELAYQAREVGWRGLDLSASLTYADSKIVDNPAFPASVGKQQPRVPKWRATFLASYAPNEHWSGSLGARYSGVQYGTLDNSDPNGFTYTGFSRYAVADLRLRYQSHQGWKAALGIDNLANKKYWAFHPYPQRTLVAELQYDW